MRQARLPSLNADDYLAGKLKNDLRHEFVNGEVYAMAAPYHPARSADNHLSSVLCPLSSERGFTMVEMITVIVILGILAAVAAPRFFDRNVFDSRGYYDQVISTLRHAQKTAIAQRRFVCVSFSAVGVTPGSVTLSLGANNSCGTPLVSPSGITPYVISSNNASFSVIPALGAISFDCLGRPRSAGGTATCSDTTGILPGSTIVTITSYTPSIIVERETGYVH